MPNNNIPKFNKNPRMTIGDLDSVVLVADNIHWKFPRTLTLATLGDKLKIVIDDSYIKQISFEQDMVVHKYSDQELHPMIPPSPNAIIQKTFIATDENYLYIWIESLKRWKRVPMAGW